VKTNSASNELEKLENFELLQIYSNKKQAMIFINDILAKMKQLGINDDDFFVKDFNEVENNTLLKLSHKDRKYKYQKAADGTLKRNQHLKEKPMFPDLVCQRYQYQCAKEPNVIYYVLRIFETTDEELKPFLGKCLVQKVDEHHQKLTKPNEVIQYMQDVIQRNDTE
jgi:hypothetical protein